MHLPNKMELLFCSNSNYLFEFGSSSLLFFSVVVKWSKTGSLLQKPLVLISTQMKLHNSTMLDNFNYSAGQELPFSKFSSCQCYIRSALKAYMCDICINTISKLKRLFLKDRAEVSKNGNPYLQFYELPEFFHGFFTPYLLWNHDKFIVVQ